MQRYAFFFGLLSLFSIGHAFRYPVLSIPFVWIGVSFGLVAFAYSSESTRPFAKRSNGKIPFWSKLINLPYFAFTKCVWHLYRILKSEGPFNEVDEKLVVGRRLRASENLPAGIDHYIDLTAEMEDPSAIRSSDAYRCFPILDGGVPSVASLLAFLGQLKPDDRVYVHCAQGHGRTGQVAAAILLMREGCSGDVREVVAGLQKGRPGIGLSGEQLQFLERFKDSCGDDL